MISKQSKAVLVIREATFDFSSGILSFWMVVSEEITSRVKSQLWLSVDF
jgi:hypothetical protein